MNYYDTFIRVAPDCPVDAAVEPTGKKQGKSVAEAEYELIAPNPYQYTQEEILFTVHYRRQGLDDEELTERREELWAEFFGKSRACLRASPLPKRYGWGVHFDAEGRAALVPVGSAEYRALAEGKGVTTVLNAMRSKKA
jgi:hypothetical protein